MRTEYKISNDCVLTSYDSPARGLFARKPGKENMYDLKSIIEIDKKNTLITIHKSTIEQFGLTLNITE